MNAPLTPSSTIGATITGANRSPRTAADRGVQHRRRAGVDHERDQRGQAGAPGERGQQQPRRLRLPAVHPQERRDHRDDREHRAQRPDQHADRPDRLLDDADRDQRAERQCHQPGDREQHPAPLRGRSRCRRRRRGNHAGEPTGADCPEAAETRPQYREGSFGSPVRVLVGIVRGPAAALQPQPRSDEEQRAREADPAGHAVARRGRDRAGVRQRVHQQARPRARPPRTRRTPTRGRPAGRARPAAGRPVAPVAALDPAAQQRTRRRSRRRRAARA